jgi:NifU-like protein involved in Fe-S cluster formation
MPRKVLELKFKGNGCGMAQEYSARYWKMKRARSWQEILKIGDFSCINPHKITQC